MKGLLTSLTIWTGAIVAALSVVDWLLTEAQKKTLKGWAESAWIWLDDHRMESLVRLLKSYIFQLAISFSVFILLNILDDAILSLQGPARFPELHVSNRAISISFLGLTILMAPGAWFVHSIVTKWLVMRSSVRALFARCLVSYLIAAIGFFVTQMGSYWLVMGGVSLCLAGMYSFPSLWFESFPWCELLLLFAFGVLVLFVQSIFLLIEVYLSYIVFFVSLLWLGLFALIRFLFRTSQFVLIRIVESPKGPVLGVSGLLVGIGALVKVFL